MGLRPLKTAGFKQPDQPNFRLVLVVLQITQLCVAQQVPNAGRADSQLERDFRYVWGVGQTSKRPVLEQQTKHQRIEVALLHPPEAAGEVVRQEVLREALRILNLADVRHDVSSG